MDSQETYAARAGRWRHPHEVQLVRGGGAILLVHDGTHEVLSQGALGPGAHHTAHCGVHPHALFNRGRHCVQASQHEHVKIARGSDGHWKERYKTYAKEVDSRFFPINFMLKT